MRGPATFNGGRHIVLHIIEEENVPRLDARLALKMSVNFRARFSASDKVAGKTMGKPPQWLTRPIHDLPMTVIGIGQTCSHHATIAKLID